MIFKDAVKILCQRYKVNAALAAETIASCFTGTQQKRREFKRMTKEAFLAYLDELEGELKAREG